MHLDSELIAVVTGATRGAGKGIAIALGQAGMTVYVTGRSQTGTDSPYGGSVDETADQVTQAGGKGVAVTLDHNDDAAVASLFADIEQRHGKLHILVNNAAKVPPVLTAPGFWQRQLDEVDLITVGLRSHYVASYLSCTGHYSTDE